MLLKDETMRTSNLFLRVQLSEMAEEQGEALSQWEWGIWMGVENAYLGTV